MHDDLVKPGGRVDLLAKDGRLVPRILSFDGDNVHRALLQRIFQVVLQLDLYDPARPLRSQPRLIEQMGIALFRVSKLRFWLNRWAT